MLILGLVLLLGSFACSATLCAVVRRAAPRVGLIDRPGLHKQHGREVALGGGLAMLGTIALAILGGAMVVYGVARWEPGWVPEAVVENLRGLGDKMPAAMLIVVGAAALAALGLVDDYRPLGPVTKLVVEFAVVIPIVWLLQIRAAVFLPSLLSAGLTVIWIVLIVNSFNFLDNMDGLSASVTVLCGLFFAAAGIVNGQFFVPALMLVVIGAAGGFLLHNLPPARLFMGDCGSLVLGYFVGLLSVLTTYTHEFSMAGRPAAILMPLVILAIPLYDTFSVVTVRFAEGRKLLLGDHSHFSHRLLARGMSVRATLATVCLATCATGLAGIFLMRLPLRLAWIVFAQTLCILGIIALLELHWPRNGNRPS
ncbi:MAG: MraY family glycosyltransferase [Phycisphaerae bacterium]|nr:MraY family glycosyltransferase [Phycisphaerae bacterium]